MKRVVIFVGAILLALAGGGTAAYLGQPMAEREELPDRARIVPQAAALPVATYIKPAFADFDDMDAHPLFNPTRLPLPGDSATAAAQGALADTSVMGIIAGPAKSVALLKVPGAAEAVRVVVGDDFQGARVTAITAISVVLRGPSGDFTLQLRPPTSGLVAAVTPPAPLPVLGSGAVPRPPAAPNNVTDMVAPNAANGQPAAGPKTVASAPGVAANGPAKTPYMVISPPVVRKKGSPLYGAANGAVINPKTGLPEL